MNTDALLTPALSFLAGALFAGGFVLSRGKNAADTRAKATLKDRKDQFISLSSHYLLTPITVIQTAIASLQEKGTTATLEERDALYEAIQRGQQRLWIFIQQIILVGQIDSGTLTPQFAVGSLGEIVDGALAAVDPFARAKKVKLHFADDLHDVREARFDHRRLKQAVIALLDNAVKFSLEEGEVRITLGYDGKNFSIKVEDAGIGIPDEVMSHITEKFYRGTETYTFDYEGIGLGLHVAQAIIRMHGGGLSVSSKPHRGTVATIEFPNL